MVRDNLHFEAQNKLQSGIAKVAKAVGVTMGTGGNNAIIEAIEYPGHIVTNDGYSIANAIILEDPIEDMGRKMLLESINRANKLSGDGSSTTCVLTAALIEEGLKETQNDVHAMDIKRSLEECLPLIEDELNKQTKVIDIEDISTVATISAEDKTIGKTIQDIYEQIGKDGLIHWDISKTPEDTYTIGSGITVDDATYVSPYMCDATETGQNTNHIRLANPYILITKQKIASASDFNVLAAYLNNKEVKDLVVFCDEYEPLVIQDIVKTRAVRGFRIILVKMPVLWKDWWYEDLSIATGAKVVDPVAGFTMKDVLNDSYLGRVDNILITKDATHLDGIKDVSNHIDKLKEDGTDDSLLRASRLNTKTARYFVGAHSDSALSYRRLKVEDAISASYQALHGGVVGGGGVALRNVALKMPDTVGGRIVAKAFTKPILQIMLNAGADMDDIKIVEYNSDMDNIGFDSRTKTAVNVFDSGIIDPKNVVLNAVKNALSVASAVITAPTIVTLPRNEEQISQGNLIIR